MSVTLTHLLMHILYVMLFIIVCLKLLSVLFRANLDRNAMIQGLQGRGRIRGGSVC